MIVLAMLSANDLFYSRHLLRSLLNQSAGALSRPCALTMSHAEEDSSAVIVIFYFLAHTGTQVLYFSFPLKARNIFSLGCSCEGVSAAWEQDGVMGHTCAIWSFFFLLLLKGISPFEFVSLLFYLMATELGTATRPVHEHS